MTYKSTFSRWCLALGATTALTFPALAQEQVDSWALVVSAEDSAMAAAEGQAAGEAAGTAEAPTDRTIGVMLLSGQSASSLRVVAAAEAIAAMFDYDVIVCDPDFDPQRVAQCGTSLVSQNVDVIFSVSQNPGPMGAALAEAEARNIPWFGTVDEVTPSEQMIGYGAPGASSAGVIVDWLFAEMEERRGPGVPLEVLAITAPTVGVASLAQEAAVMAAADASDTVDVVIKHDLDLGNAVQDTLSITTQALQQYPGLAGTWTVCDFCVPLFAQAVDAAGIAPENRPIISGNYATPQTIAGLRDGSIDGIVDLPWEASVYVAMDQMLSHWARDTEVATSFDVFSDGYALEFMQPYMVTSDNVGASGPAPVFGPDYESFFLAKWQAEYGVGQ